MLSGNWGVEKKKFECVSIVFVRLCFLKKKKRNKVHINKNLTSIRWTMFAITLLTFQNVIKTFIFKFIYFETESEQGMGRERGREKESQAGSVLSMQSLTQGSNSQTKRS